MTVRRPVVVVAGQLQELPAGDVVANGVLPFYKASGVSSPISLITTGLTSALPFFIAAGTSSNIPMA